MDKFKISGKVVKKMEVETFDSGFRKQVVVVDTAFDGAKWPNTIPFTFKKDNIETWADRANEGDSVMVTFCVDGREYNGKYYSDITGLEIEVTESAEPKDKPKTAKSWKELLALGKAWGEGDDAVKERCKKLGKAFADMKESDWAWLAAQIVAEKEREHEKAEVNDDNRPGTLKIIDDVSDDIPF